MADPVQDLRQALLNFRSDVQEMNKFAAIDQANQAVNQIRSSQENEANKRNALQGIANDLVSRLAIAGTPATTIQQVAGVVGPAPLRSAEQAVLEGKATGNEELVQQAVEADRALREPREEAQLQRDLIRSGAQDRKLEAQQKKEAAKLDVGSRDEIVAGMNVVKVLADLEQNVDKISRSAQIGTRFGTARANAQLAALKTKAEALVVDVARASEKGVLTDSDVKRYQEIVGSIGDVRTLPSLKGSWSALGERARLKLDSRFTALEDEGKNLSNHRATLAKFEQSLQDRMAAGAPAAGAGNRIVSATDKRTGKKVRLELDANGKPIRVVQ